MTTGVGVSDLACQKSSLFRSCSPYGTSVNVGTSGLLFEFGGYVFGAVPVSPAETKAVRDSKLTTQQVARAVAYSVLIMSVFS
jgi:hypothetical protein